MAYEEKPLGSYKALKERLELPLNTSHSTIDPRMAAAFATATKEKEEKGK